MAENERKINIDFSKIDQRFQGATVSNEDLKLLDPKTLGKRVGTLVEKYGKKDSDGAVSQQQ